MGVDQVLQVEMVLPNGYHVKFGPTEWEDASAEGFAYPRTKVVSGEYAEATRMNKMRRNGSGELVPKTLILILVICGLL